MRIGLDAHMVGTRETGNETYVKGLIDGLRIVPHDVELLVYGAGSPWLESDRHVGFNRLLSTNSYMRLGIELPLRSLAQRLDVLHVTYVAPLWSSAPIALTVHDICYETNPEWFSERDVRMLSAQVPRSIKAARHVITCSRSSRDAMVEHYHVPEDKISVIYLGPGRAAMPIGIDVARAELANTGLKVDRPYLLAVGNVQPRKNLVRLVEAFMALIAKGHDIDLVVVGPSHYRAAEAFEAAARVADRVHFTGYVTDRQLAACYRCATVFVFPSLFEGFGLPAVEAMAHGLPVACSDTGSFPEVCGDAALYFDPRSVESITDAVDRILADGDLRVRLTDAGLARARELTWTKTAELTYHVYQELQR